MNALFILANLLALFVIVCVMAVTWKRYEHSRFESQMEGIGRPLTDKELNKDVRKVFAALARGDRRVHRKVGDL